MNATEVVLRFLESVGRRSEAEFYVKLFRAEARERFAVIAVDPSVLRQTLDAVVLDLRFLSALELTPVVLLGLKDSGDLPRLAARLERHLEDTQVPAKRVAFPNSPEAQQELVDLIRAGTIPLVGLGPEAGATPTERFNALGDLVASLHTRKLLILRRRGALRHRGSRLPMINLTTDYVQFAQSRELTDKDKALLEECRRLVFERVPHRVLIALCSPLELLRELFTVRGAGTLLRSGAVIERKANLADVNRERLIELLRSSFGRTPSDDFLVRPVSRIYLEEAYRGIAMLVDTPLGAYLTKFAVTPEAQGEGIGRDLWQALTADYRHIFWRARPDNAINDWYAKECDGMQKLASWYVFWKGLSPAQISEAIAFSLAQPIDLIENPILADGSEA